MDDLLARLTSRKFLLTVLGILLALGQTATGAITPDQALEAIKVLIVGYMGAEGLADAFGRLKPTIAADPSPKPEAPLVPATH